MMIRSGFDLHFHPDEYGISPQRYIWETVDISRYGLVTCATEQYARAFAADMVRCSESAFWPGTFPGRIPLVIEIFESGRSDSEGQWCVSWDRPSDVFKKKKRS